MGPSHQILTAAQMRAAEDHLIAQGTSVEALMERAGAGAARWVHRVAAGRRVTVLCGPGNNGGDGYVIARVLREAGLAVQLVAPIAPATAAASVARANYGDPLVSSAKGEVLVDCLFGTGLARPLSDDLLGLLRDHVARHETRIAIDLPSGIESDSGTLLNPSLPDYDLTIALGAWKRAHWTMPAAARMGARRLVDIGCAEQTGAAVLASPPQLSPPPPDAHKYSRGLLAVIAGAMPGAALLASRAAQHGGAGYVKLLCESASLPAPHDLVVVRDSLETALADPRIDAVLIGPGLGRGEDARQKLARALGANIPLVLDADALTLLRPAMLGRRTAPLVATPHAGELATLFDSFAVAGTDRFTKLADLARAIGGTVIAKGPDTLIQSPQGAPCVMPPASSWLSVAGTGDVLAGLVASRLATTGDPLASAVEACFLHREAAKIAGPAFSAGSLIDAISEAYGAFL